jgi:carbon-monoxide dehydrogenase medium subunit
MIPAAFEYRAPSSIQEALTILQERPGEAKLMAGGHSLLPMMKLRLAAPGLVVDLRQLRDQLSHIRLDGGTLRVGAMTPHAEVMASPVVQHRVPLLAETAATIADIQVRNRGTIGGSIAHADPSADYPAALLALDAQVAVQGPEGMRTIGIDDFLMDAFFTTLGEAEVITEVSVPVPGPRTGSAYLKFANKASHFAIVGVAALVQLDGQGRLGHVAIGITGAGPRAVRARSVEEALRGQRPTPQAIETASARASDGIDSFLSDLHGSPEYRANLCRVLTKRATLQAVERAQAGG